MVDVCGTASSVHFSITARPNRALSPGSALCVFALVAVVTMLFALGCLLLGAWPVVPFAVVELMAFFLSFRYVWRHGGDYERLSMDDDKILLEMHEPGRDRHMELSGYWTMVLLDYMPDGHCRRLALRSHGREIEFGRFLNSDERLSLGRQLKSRVGGFMA